MEKYLQQVKKMYRNYFENKDVKTLEKEIYNTDDNEKKVEIELKRIDRFLKDNIDYFKKYSYKYYAIRSKFKQYKEFSDTDSLHEIMENIVELEILCGMKIALLQILCDDAYDNQISARKK